MGRWLNKIKNEFVDAPEKLAEPVTQVLLDESEAHFDKNKDLKIIPFTDKQVEKLLAKYPDNQELWNKFWNFMGEQSDLGAPFVYVYSCYLALEAGWLKRSC